MRVEARRTYYGYGSNLDGLPELAGIQRTGVNPLRCTIAYNKYGGYCVPFSSRHRVAAETVLGFGVYEPDMIDFLTSNCGSGDVVHAGAFFGDFLPALSIACADDALVWAFEPNTENWRCAAVTVQLNELVNVKLAHAALGEADQTLFLKTHTAAGQALGGMSQIQADRDIPAADGEFVPVLSIDQTVPADRPISIIQLDVEGHELHALKGAIETLRRWRPIIVVELLPDSCLPADPWFTESILGMGYAAVATIYSNTVYSVSS